MVFAMLAPAPGYVRPITVAVMLPVAYRPGIGLVVLVEHLGVLVGDHTATRTDVAREDLVA